MKKRFGFALFVSLLTAAQGVGSPIYVDGDLPTASSTTYDPGTRGASGGADTAYRTLAGAISVATAGVTVIIREGSYADRLQPQFSGTAAEPITFQAFGTEAVYLTSSPGMDLSNRSHLLIDGLRVEDRTWLEGRNTHHTVLKNCVFRRSPAGGTTGNVRFIASHHNKILNNIIEDGADNLLLIDSNYNLIQGNTMLEGRHSIFGIRCGDFNVIRGNYFSNTMQKIGEVYDCGADTSAVPNSFNSTRGNVIEGNVFAGTDTYYSTSGGNGIQYAGQNGIVRHNVFYHCNVGIGMQIYGDEALYNENNRIYHNVFHQNHGAGIAIRSGTTGNYFFNNILADNRGCISDCNGTSPGQIVFRSPIGPTARFANNDLFYQQPGQAVIEEEFSSGFTITQFAAANPGQFLGTLETDPFFVNSTTNDFRLQTGSPMIDAGAFLTNTVGAGSGTSMSVEDVTPFYDGYGIEGEQGDLVQLQGQAQAVRITGIDLAANSLTLDRPLTWTSGQGLSLRYHGGAPDIGAFEHASPAETDSDRDGLCDLFETRYGQGADMDPFSDSDGDGLTALEEYCHGLDPTTPQGKAITDVEAVQSGNEQYLHVHYTIDPLASNFVTLRIERSTDIADMNSWQTDQTVLVSSTPSATNPALLDIVERSPVPISTQESPLFVRFRYEPDGIETPDTTPPSTPGDLQAVAATSSQINLTWAASSDNIGVSGYRVFRDDILVRTVSGNAYQDIGLTPETEYTYQVVAFDVSDNASAPSAPASATTDAPPSAGTLEIRVNAPADDAEEEVATGWISLTSSDLELIRDADTDQLVGMRFVNLMLPQGAAITNAYLLFEVDETDSGDTTLVIQAENTDSAATFDTTTGNISARPRTTAKESWSPGAWTTIGASQQTPDISSIIEEVIHRPGWASGNALSIIITGTGKRTGASYDGEPNGAPLLHIEYDDPPVPTPPAPLGTR